MGPMARQAILNTVLTYVGIALGFLNVVVLYPRVLDSEEVGLTRLLVAMATVVAQVGQLGAENTVIRFFPYFRDPERKHRGILAMLLVFGLVVGLTAVMILGLLHEQFASIFSDRNALYARHGMLILPLVFGEIYFLLLRSYSRSLRRTVQPIFLREFILRLLQTALILIQAWHPLRFNTFMVLYVGIFLLCTLALVLDLWRSGHLKPGFAEWKLSRRMRRSMVTFSSYTLSAGLAGIVLGNMDQLMIGALLGDGLRNVAHYAVAFYFGSVIAAPGRALYMAAVPMVADAWKQRNLPLLAELYRRSSLVQTLVSGFLFLLMWMSLDDLFELLPMEYAAGAKVAWVIGLAYALNSTAGLSVGIISMSRSYRLDAYSSFTMIAVNAGANFILIQYMGIIGAAWATFVSLIFVNILRTGYLWKRYGLWPYGWDTLKVVLLIGVLALVFPWIPLTGMVMVDIVLRSVLITIVFVSIAHVLGLLTELQPLLDRSGFGTKGG